jgi:hypothetical protein
MRVGATPGEERTRGILAAIAFLLGVGSIYGVATASSGSWTRFIWPSIYVFLAWRFLVMGLYVSDWGVRVNNPVLTYWHPWRDVEHFELGSTGEMFARKAKGIVVVTKANKRRLAWALTTSRMIPKAVSTESQQELLAWLNARIPAGAAETEAR